MALFTIVYFFRRVKTRRYNICRAAGSIFGALHFPPLGGGRRASAQKCASFKEVIN